MYFEFIVNNSFDFLSHFSGKLNVPIHDHQLIIPDSFGKGHIKRIELEPNFKLIIHQYSLNEDFVLKRIASETPHDIITIIFNNNDLPVSLLTKGQQEIQFSRNNDSAIQIASGDLDAEIRFPARTEINFAVINVKAALIGTLLNLTQPNHIVKHIIDNKSTFLYYESMTLDIQKVLKQLVHFDESNSLSNLYCRIKVQELLYLLFDKLVKRETVRYSQMNKAAIDQLFAIRTQLLADLSIHPHLNTLATKAGMSETKMKMLFKQIFGDSIYNYYQKARMEEAAFLLRQKGLSVSETGYQLGFSNLSHFSRLFEKHHGSKPKKYALAD